MFHLLTYRRPKMVNSTLGGVEVMSTCVPVCKLETPKVPNPLVQGRKRHRRRGPRLTGVSKQRKSANARERNRVRVINNALETLRDLIPLLPTEKRPSKIETVRLAALYIHHLTELLTGVESGKTAMEQGKKQRSQRSTVIVKQEKF